MRARKFNKTVPDFTSVKEIHRFGNVYEGYTSITMIMPDRSAGRKARYTVLRMWVNDHKKSSQTRVIGRELPLKDAREVATRPEVCDDMPLGGW